MEIKKIGSFIKQRRKELSLSQKDVADFLVVTIPTISKWEKDERIPDLSYFSSLCKILKVDISSLINCESRQNNDFDLNNDFDINSFANHFSYLRKKNNYTLISLAKLINISYQTISKWENKESTPNIYTLAQLAKIFNVSLKELYYGKEFHDENQKDNKRINTLFILLSLIVVCVIGFILSLLLFNDNDNEFDVSINSENKAVINRYYGDSKNVVIPSNISVNNQVVEVSELSFNLLCDCKDIESLTIPFVGKSLDEDNYLGYLFGAESVEYNDRFIPQSLKNIIITSSTSISSYAFYNCKDIEKITISNTVTSIAADAFLGCENLKYNVDNNLNYLPTFENEYYALINVIDDQQKEYDINKNTKLIAGNVFNKNINFESIVIPESIKYISSSAFGGTNALKDVYFEGSIEDWCNIYFENYSSNPMYNTAENFYILKDNLYSEVKEIIIPVSITRIGQYQFDGFKNINKMYIHDNVISIGKTAFGYCTSLESVFIPKSVVTIESEIFRACLDIDVYCEVNSKPIGWNDNWFNNIDNIYWGSERV